MANGNDPANIAYIIVDNGFYYVAYKEKVKVPEIIVSAKGVANGLSEEYNDGWDFGPDSYNPNSTSAIPYTQTSGFLEAWNYAQNQILNGIYSTILIRGNIVLNVPITLSSPTLTDTAPKVITESTGSAVITLNIPDAEGYAITVDTTNYSEVNFYFTGFVVSASQESGGFLYIDNVNTSNNNNIRLENINFGNGTYTSYPIYLNNMKWVRFLHLQYYVTLTADSNAYVANSNVFEFYGTNPQYGFTLNNITVAILRGNNTLYYAFISLENIGYCRIESFLLNGLNITGTVNSLDLIGGVQSPYGSFINLGSGTSATINNLRIENCVWDQHGNASLLGSGITVNNFAIMPKNLTTGSITASNGYTMSFMPSPTLSANPPVSGTVYQNTNPYDIEIDLPAYATTAGTAGYVTVAKGPSSTPTAIGNQYVSGDTSDTSEQIIRLRVPANWYYEFTASGVTFGTASVFAD